MGNKSYTVTFHYGNGVIDGMVIDDAQSPKQAQIAAIVYTTGLGYLRDIHVNETVPDDSKYARHQALKQIGE
jgi:hypothetical protein